GPGSTPPLQLLAVFQSPEPPIQLMVARSVRSSNRSKLSWRPVTLRRRGRRRVDLDDLETEFVRGRCAERIISGAVHRARLRDLPMRHPVFEKETRPLVLDAPGLAQLKLRSLAARLLEQHRVSGPRLLRWSPPAAQALLRALSMRTKPGQI